ncbi:Na(+)-translocating NADH-quinone reductase subunit C [Shimwellia blattae]|uniref:Na(+)-translocating NADH-quinone reductase subunit C n=1 Tax=Shimwellia blattae (strain ATCC 29907 / DSM 4481 / JCM 1650 / NBRC 105725 / CDC 9005-74) TaxID=630626 RepID=I2BCE4_SHIBC|nr:Na(+)-translocating NADH-quinone reductase subunit C [Shimwellia blattae]AFJ48198.1 Na(+)-translocating NADH-quinone reductase subunit C [Shimwellia blattae DSM 4481 = NBRC 105725]GAB82757.1 Na(+)-translocating NADH-quinone reductase subunit C [Shimwellia blattae DSM 4481 = NBRC 105725]VDY65694.1 Na(+)-translocating NADH-quinone reductase subunit C [Shimwellia blattae]VEC25402.1 Na(+)-translocating NADH-quinone reductase subunit C [Shimwellia blattae]
MAESKNKDSTGKTLLVVLILCLVCSVVVSGAAVGLKSRQEAQKVLDKQRNILSVTGMLQPGMSDAAVMAAFDSQVTPRLLDLKTGTLLDKDPASFNPTLAARDPAQNTTLGGDQDPAGIRKRANVVEIYLVRDAQKQLQEIVLPVYGTGLWSVMHAFVALGPDGSTVKGITYYDHGETPGLGGEIENPAWRAQWVGKKLLDEGGKPAIRIVKGGARQGDEHGVDGLSGATLTANGVQRSFDFWLGDMGFGPFLKQVREGALNNG